MTQKPPHVVVVRCSLLDGYDPIAEIDKLVRTKKSAWFAKYGQPLGPQIGETLQDRARDVYALLVHKGKAEDGGQYILKLYRVLDITKDETPPSGSFPRYYVAFLSRIRTWIRLAPYEGVAVTFDDLTTRSSGLPLRKSLAQSMKGHFNAVLQVGQHV